ncbi:MAG TPA: 50S ribosomal protein L6 [Rhizomicrobium sp.]|nr:50S ribosomal protein L6 [Rhizomicrobium sp.]
MSRVGNSPVTVPAGVTIQLNGRKLSAKGKLGELHIDVSEQVEAKVEGGKVVFAPVNDSKKARMMWGTTRNLVRNMVTGVSQGFRKNLEISGVGYRAAVQGKTLQLQLGYSHDVNFPIPDDVTIKCEKPTAITITGRDKQRVGQIAAEIRAYREPEPYKGKGIKYDTETILRKEGKKK